MTTPPDVPSSRSARKDATRRSIVVALAAALLYGTWAFLANRSHGVDAGREAAAVQATLSFVTTFSLTMLIEVAFRHLGQPWLRVLRGSATGIAVSVTLTVGAHAALGTPELLITVAPSLLIGSTYSFLYSVGLLRRVSGTSPTGRDLLLAED